MKKYFLLTIAFLTALGCKEINAANQVQITVRAIIEYDAQMEALQDLNVKTTLNPRQDAGWVVLNNNTSSHDGYGVISHSAQSGHFTAYVPSKGDLRVSEAELEQNGVKFSNIAINEFGENHYLLEGKLSYENGAPREGEYDLGALNVHYTPE
ncbi:MAG: hypothetical protein IJ529_01525 [Alphaproteobacteria bacterium]|nr:hypothetical protein [Alphaproteobacteria bacterium]MBR1648611.1 hypothetical protein [Alphaproteobacteria bacterium]